MRRSILQTEDLDFEATGDGCKQVFWGLLVVAIDLEFNQFDILYDPIGWGVVLFGASKMAGAISGGGPLLILTALQLVYSIFVLFTPAGPVRSGFYFDTSPRGLYETAGELMFIAFVWVLCGGLMELALMTSQPDEHRNANLSRWLLLACVGLTLLLLLPPMRAPVMLVIAALLAISFILLLMTLHQMGRILQDAAWDSVGGTDITETAPTLFPPDEESEDRREEGKE